MATTTSSSFRRMHPAAASSTSPRCNAIATPFSPASPARWPLLVPGRSGYAPNAGGNGFTSSTPPPKPSWQRTNPTPGGTTNWEKAREEMKKKEEERKRREELEKKAKEKADKEKWEQAAARAKELREKLARDEEARKKTQKEKEDRERREREARSKASAASASQAPKNYHKPTASSYMGDEDGYSFRPYDNPKPKRAEKVDSQGSLFSESSYAASHSTARTTPPPSHRGPYHNKDPDKVTIRAVYAFTDLFPKPVAQLVSGQGSVTDGLVLKMTTEGLFIDDDIRGVPQREWDVRAWTMKLVEVYCPCFNARFASNVPPPSSSSRFKFHSKEKDPVLRFLSGASAHGPPALSADETDVVLSEFLSVCRADCTSSHSSREPANNASQNGDMGGRHILRASVRDAENKKYVFIIDESEAWKVAVGLQRLRKGSQRALGGGSRNWGALTEPLEHRAGASVLGCTYGTVPVVMVELLPL
ncbi:hypothetical protein FH972_025466 [Carpinus fangiana]|uniref:Uncharacterized protein n=1 Tax=Carpinus fangiana TaxID=176857 RepID=A0A5N6L3P5_9ROSI|nr:hypothetical protein FH972_025466 [Carpinus fangiana]